MQASLTPNHKAAIINEIVFNYLEGSEMEYKSVDLVVQMANADHYSM